MTERDRDTIGLTPETQAIVEEILARGWFITGEDVARFALAYAIRSKVEEGTTQGTDTRWAAGNFDRTLEIRALLAALFPTCETPIRLMQHLVNEGLRRIAARMQSEAVGPDDLMD
jgi:hypothetical protein